MSRRLIQISFLITIAVLQFFEPSIGVQASDPNPIIVEHNGHFGAVSEHGEVVIPLIYSRFDEFDVEGFAVVELADNRKLGCVHASGRTVVPPVWDYLSVLKDGTIWASAAQTCLYDYDGKVLCKYEFSCTDPWNSAGLAPQIRGDDYVLVDRIGNAVGKLWDSLHSLHQGRRLSRSNDSTVAANNESFIAEKWHADESRSHCFILDKNGDVVKLPVSEPVLGIYPAAFPPGWFRVEDGHSKYGYIDEACDLRVPFVWDDLGPYVQFHSGAAAVCRARQGRRSGFLTLDGELTLGGLAEERFYSDFSANGYAQFADNRVRTVIADGPPHTT